MPFKWEKLQTLLAIALVVAAVAGLLGWMYYVLIIVMHIPVADIIGWALLIVGSLYVLSFSFRLACMVSEWGWALKWQFALFLLGLALVPSGAIILQFLTNTIFMYQIGPALVTFALGAVGAFAIFYGAIRLLDAAYTRRWFCFIIA